jgi:tetratricopeptide (TPR) repeat protein
MNFPATLLSLAVAGSALWAIHSHREAPDVSAHEYLMRPGTDYNRVAALYTQALRDDAANPYRWADLGEALAAKRDFPPARYCFRRALELNRRLPQIWLRDANFHFRLDENDAALLSAARVLKTVSDYDAVLFSYLDRTTPDPGRVLGQIGEDRRAAVSYANHLIGGGKIEEARAVWQYLVGSRLADRRLTVSYIDLLLTHQRYVAARDDWARYNTAAGLPSSSDANLLFNAGFEQDPSGAALDWRIQPSDQFESAIDDTVAHDGKRSLRIHFLGTGNVSYRNLTQVAVVQPGSYEFRAWVRTSEITTDEGMRLEIYDARSPARLKLGIGPFRGTSPWTYVRESFQVRQGTELIAIAAVRTPSAKFDNKISGDFWLDSTELLRKSHLY